MDETNFNLIQQIDEISIRDLENNITRGFPGTKARQHAVGPVQIPIVRLTPYVPSHSLYAEGQANNRGHRYNPEIMFQEVNFEDQETPTNITFTGSDNNEYNIAQPVPLMGNNVQVRCNCLDFHYRFARQNAGDDALVGKAPPPYRRKTQTRPPANPMHVPGMCKHLLALVDELQKMGIVARG